MTYDNNMHSATVQDISPESERNNFSEFPSVPGPVRIIVPNEEDHSFHLNEEFLERILLNPRVADKKVLLEFFCTTTPNLDDPFINGYNFSKKVLKKPELLITDLVY